MNIEDLSKELSSVGIQNETELEQFRIRFLGSKNILKDLYAALKDIPNDQKRAYGQQVNELKLKAEEIYASAKAAFTQAQNQSNQKNIFLASNKDIFRQSKNLNKKKIIAQ